MKVGIQNIKPVDDVAFSRYPMPAPEDFVVKGSHSRHHGAPGICMGDMHYELELGIVLAGAWELRFDTTWIVAGPGEVWLTGTCEPHQFGMQRGPCELVVLAIMPHALATVMVPGAEAVNWLAPFMMPPPLRPRVPADRRPEMLAIGHRLVAILDKPSYPEQQRQLMLLTLEVLELLQRNWQTDMDLDLPPRKAYECTNEALRFVFESTERLPAQRIAVRLGVSRFRFHRLFQQTMGISFAKFALRHRLSLAARALRASEDSVKQIALMAGFVDSSHLVHAFKTHYGCTPREYRLSPVPGRVS